MEPQSIPGDIEEFAALLDLLPTPSALAMKSEAHVRRNRAFSGLIGGPGQTARFFCDGIELEPDELPAHVAMRTGGDVRGVELEMHAQGRIVYLLGSAAPIRDHAGNVLGAVATFADVSDRHNLQISNDAMSARLKYLEQAGQELSESLDLRAVLDTLSRILVPRFADCVAVTMLDDNGQLTIGSLHHAKRDIAKDFADLRARNHQAEPSRFFVSERVRATGAGEIIKDLAVALNDAGADDAYREYVRMLQEDFGLDQAVVVPMKNRGVFTGLFVAYGDASRNYTQDDIPLLEELGRRAASAVDNARSYERQRRLSETLQESLLPSRLPLVPELQFDAVYTPADDEGQVGGDWYDAFDFPDGRIGVSIGDVTGQGVKAAVVMSKVRHVIKALALYEDDPTKLLNAADVILLKNYPDAIVTALVGVIDLREGTFTYSTAGHPTPYLLRDGRVLQMPASGLPLGLRTADEPEPATFTLCVRDLILLYTDGLLESTHDLREGDRRITAALTELDHETIREAAHAVRAAVLHDGSRDDVALLSVRVMQLENNRPPEILEWSFDSSDVRLAHDSRKLFLTHLTDLGRPGEDYSGAELVFGELIGNVVRHTAGRVCVRVDWSGEYPELLVRDSGDGFDLATSLPQDVLSEAGRGLFLINALTREFRINAAPEGGTLARAVLQIDRG